MAERGSRASARNRPIPKRERLGSQRSGTGVAHWATLGPTTLPGALHWVGSSDCRTQCLQRGSAVSAGPGLELQPHAHGWQQASMPTGSGLLPCPVERVRSAGQIGTCSWMFSCMW